MTPTPTERAAELACPKCGAAEGGFFVAKDFNGNPFPTGATAEWICGTYAVGDDIRESPACTITALQQQLADAEDAMRALACQLSAGGYNSTDFEPKVFYEKINWGIGEMIQRQLKLEQQLADARLLARAANSWNRARVCWDAKDGEIHVLNEHGEIAMFIDDGFITDGLPVLTDELRAALQKAIGET